MGVSVTMDNKYLCFYRGERIEVQAQSDRAAQQKAAMLLRAKRVYEVSTVLIGDPRPPTELIKSNLA